jgi:hypothetical protein
MKKPAGMLTFVMALSIAFSAAAKEGKLRALLIGANGYSENYALDGGTVEKSVPAMVNAIIKLHDMGEYAGYEIDVYADDVNGKVLPKPNIVPAAGSKLHWDNASTPTYHNMDRAFSNFFGDSKLDEKDTLIFFFTGHGGIEGGDVKLSPSQINAQNSYDRRKIALSSIFDEANKAAKKAKRVIVILDNCRNKGPQTPANKIAGLSYLKALPENLSDKLMVVMSTEYGKFAHIDRVASMGIFTKHLVKILSGDIPDESLPFPGILNAHYVIKFINDSVNSDPVLKNRSKPVQQNIVSYPQYPKMVLRGPDDIQDALVYMSQTADAGKLGKGRNTAAKTVPKRIARKWASLRNHGVLLRRIKALRGSSDAPIKVKRAKNNKYAAKILAASSKIFALRKATETSKCQSKTERFWLPSTKTGESTSRAISSHLKSIISAYRDPENTEVMPTRIMVVPSLNLVRGGAWHLRWLFIDMETNHWFACETKVAGAENPENFEYHTFKYNVAKMLKSLQIFDHRMREKKIFISCFLFWDLTRPLISTQLTANTSANSDEAQRIIALMETWVTFPLDLLNNIRNTTSMPSEGFTFEYLEDDAVEAKCKDHAPGALNQFEKRMLEEVGLSGQPFRFPTDEIDEEKKYDYVVGGIIQKISDKNIIQIKPKVNIWHWSKFTKSSMPQIPADRFDPEKFNKILISRTARSLSRHRNEFPSHNSRISE